MSQAGPGTTQAEPGIGRTGPGAGQAERRMDQTGRGVHHTGHSAPGVDEPRRGTDHPWHGAGGPTALGTSHAKHNTVQATLGTGNARLDTVQVPRGTDHAPLGTYQVSRSTGHASRSTGEAERAATPTGSPATVTPPLRAAAPRQAMQAPPAAAQEPVGVAVPPGSRPESLARRPVTTVSRPDTPFSGPKAAKVVTREKLTHARVLLSQRIAQAPGTPPGTYATKAGEAVAFARAQLGKPCVWGASGPGSYDCAGLTQAAWKSAGVTLPRTAPEQAGVGIPVPPAEARPGDLVFFHDDAGHVGLCTGDGMMIHAPRPGAYVREEPVSVLGEAAVHSVVRPG
ncbi:MULTISPECIES: C40 family peptidase [Streptomyces]|uniref:C40 family peptidase n=1 Tax=Streptomyces eurythermus TaxID=42237 RepID=A0ABW6YYW2_9ACTN|nr:MULTISPECIES: C40 family peptidase [Streptomyces]